MVSRKAVVLVMNKQGQVRTDLPDGSTVYLEPKDALNVIAERYAKANDISVLNAKIELGMIRITPKKYIAKKVGIVHSIKVHFDTALRAIKNKLQSLKAIK